MEKIDLTKCNNCRFRAEISNSGPVSGRIVVDKGVYLEDEKGDFIGVLSPDGEEIMSMSGRGITDLEIVPRDPETYRDWQVGDIIWDSHESGDNGRIIFRSGDFVAADIGGCLCYTCEEMHGSGWRLVLTDIEQQIIDEKKKYEPQDGDIVSWKDKDDDGDPAVSIYKERDRGYATIFANGLTQYSRYFTLAMNIIRPATEDEKQRLFDAMAKEGKRWNAEKKVVEDIPKPHEFKTGEPVLVRNNKDRWIIAVFNRIADDPDYQYMAFNGDDSVEYKQCIPYNERTMHLLGTSKDYKEE